MKLGQCETCRLAPIHSPARSLTSSGSSGCEAVKREPALRVVKGTDALKGWQGLCQALPTPPRWALALLLPELPSSPLSPGGGGEGSGGGSLSQKALPMAKSNLNSGPPGFRPELFLAHLFSALRTTHHPLPSPPAPPVRNKGFTFFNINGQSANMKPHKHISKGSD